MKLNELDKAILKMLQQDATLPYKHIADALNKSKSTICNHVKKLTKMKVILGTKAQLNPSMLKIETIGCIYLKTDTPMEQLRTELTGIKGLCSCTSITGTTSIRVKIAVDSMKNFNRIKDKIASIPNVKVVDNYLELEDIIPDQGFDF